MFLPLRLENKNMLDIKFIKEHRDLVKSAAIKKHINVDVDKLLRLDSERLELLREIEALRAEQNTASLKIGQSEGENRESAIIAMRTLKEGLKNKLYCLVKLNV
jgi:seryl-tRNA synthetase